MVERPAPEKEEDKFSLPPKNKKDQPGDPSSSTLVEKEKQAASARAVPNSKKATSTTKTLTKRAHRQQLRQHQKNTWPQQPKLQSAEARARAYLRVAGLAAFRDDEEADPHGDQQDDEKKKKDGQESTSRSQKSKSVSKKKTNNHSNPSSTTTLPPLVVQGPMVQFARKLASNDVRVRHATVRILKHYLKAKCTWDPSATSSTDQGLTRLGWSELDLLKLWKCLWWTLYQADQVPVQQELSRHLAALLWCVAGTEEEDEYAGQVYLHMYSHQSPDDDDEYNDGEVDDEEYDEDDMKEEEDDEDMNGDRVNPKTAKKPHVRRPVLQDDEDDEEREEVDDEEEEEEPGVRRVYIDDEYDQEEEDDDEEEIDDEEWKEERNLRRMFVDDEAEEGEDDDEADEGDQDEGNEEEVGDEEWEEDNGRRFIDDEADEEEDDDDEADEGDQDEDYEDNDDEEEEPNGRRVYIDDEASEDNQHEFDHRRGKSHDSLERGSDDAYGENEENEDGNQGEDGDEEDDAGEEEDEDDDDDDDDGIPDLEAPHCRGAHLASLFVRTFFRTLVREWGKMDKYRIDKFYTLMRDMMHQIYTYMAKRHWNLGIIRLFNDSIYEEVLSLTPNGLRYHLIDLALEELGKVEAKSPMHLTEATFLDCMEPFLAVTQNGGGGDDTVQSRVVENILIRFLDEYSVVSAKAVNLGKILAARNKSEVLLFDQVHVGTVAQFIFDLASDKATKDNYRKGLYEVHKRYMRRLKLVGNDVQLQVEDDEMDTEPITPGIGAAHQNAGQARANHKERKAGADEDNNENQSESKVKTIIRKRSSEKIIKEQEEKVKIQVNAVATPKKNKMNAVSNLQQTNGNSTKPHPTEPRENENRGKAMLEGDNGKKMGKMEEKANRSTTAVATHVEKSKDSMKKVAAADAVTEKPANTNLSLSTAVVMNDDGLATAAKKRKRKKKDKKPPPPAEQLASTTPDDSKVSEEEVTISWQVQKAAQLKVVALAKPSAATSTSAAPTASKTMGSILDSTNKRKASGSSHHAMTASTATTSTTSGSKRVKFGHSIQAKSYKASMEDLVTMEPPRTPDVEPTQGILRRRRASFPTTLAATPSSASQQQHRPASLKKKPGQPQQARRSPSQLPTRTNQKKRLSAPATAGPRGNNKSRRPQARDYF